MEDTVKNFFDVIFEGFQTAIIVGGAIWAYIRFFREGMHRPRIELDIECSFFGPQNDRYVAAFVIHATNRGNIEHRFNEIRLRVRGIKSDMPLQALKEHEPLLAFPEEDFDTVNIIAKKPRYYFVRPGVHQKFSFVTSIPASWKFVLARASFKYEASNELHTSERAFEVKTTDKESLAYVY
jgi:hypothetical protein